MDGWVGERQQKYQLVIATIETEGSIDLRY